MYFEKKISEQFFEIEKSPKIFLQITKRETTVPIENKRTIEKNKRKFSFSFFSLLTILHRLS
jgi:hypothetical protein